MKKRLTAVLNFFAFNLLFFALYLNFIHKDGELQQSTSISSTPAATVQGTKLVQHPEQYTHKMDAKEGTTETSVSSNIAAQPRYN